MTFLTRFVLKSAKAKMLQLDRRVKELEAEIAEYRLIFCPERCQFKTDEKKCEAYTAVAVLGPWMLRTANNGKPMRHPLCYESAKEAK